MEQPLLSSSCKRLWMTCRRARSSWQPSFARQRRCLATEGRPERGTVGRIQLQQRGKQQDPDESEALKQMRVVPATPSYFTAAPTFTDDMLKLSFLLDRYYHLPQSPAPEETSWITLAQYTKQIDQRVRPGAFERMMGIVTRLSSIHPPLMPAEVSKALDRYKRLVQTRVTKRKESVPDKYGRTRGIGKRKTSSAQCLVVEGDGEVLVNGTTLTNYFGKLSDRETAIWALKVTDRAGKYNVWARTSGGGTTGQADAIKLAVAKALVAQEPVLEPSLRIAGVLDRDPRVVERKKPGKLKARKMPAWVKR